MASLKFATPAGAGPVVIAVLSALIGIWLTFEPELFNDGDTYWHLAAGQLMVETLSIPTVDPFSFTMRGHPWVAHEWLAEVATALAFRLGGWPAVASLHAAAAGVTLYMAGQWIARALPLRHVIVVLALLVPVLAPFTLARPHVLAWPLLTGFTLLLLRARDENRTPSLWGVAIMLVWANLHASFALGLALAAAFGLEALIQAGDRPRVIRQWGLYGLGLLLAALATPHGVDGLLFPLQVSSMGMVDTIAEWRPTSWPKDWAFFAVALVASVAAALRWRALGPVRLFVLAGLLVMAFQHSRHQVPFALLATLLIGPAIGREGRPREAFALAHVALLAGLVALVAVRQAFPLVPQGRGSAPGAAIAALPSTLRAQPVLNSYSFGGPLILAHIAPYIDGRVDMYGDAFLREHQRMMRADMATFRRVAKRDELAWTIIAPREPLAAKLDEEPGWRRLYADEHAVIHVNEN